MIFHEKKQLLDYLNDYYELRDKIVLTANEYALIFKIIDENPSKDARELIPILTAEIDKYRKKYMDFIMPIKPVTVMQFPWRCKREVDDS